LESIHFDPSDDNLSVETTGRLVDADEFKVDKGHHVPGDEVLLTKQMKVLLFLSGTGRITAENADPTMFKKGDCLLVPAAFKGVMQFAANCEYLIASVW